MESFFTRYKNGLVLVAVLLVQLFGLALQVRRPLPNSPDSKPVRLLRYWVISVLGPPARVSHGAGRGARGFWANYIDLRNVREQNHDLQAEIDRLRLEQGAIAEDARQGQRLQRLLDFKEHYIYKTVTAQVIGTAGSDRSRLLIVDKGSNDGLALEMPVITPDGIVGKVREVFPGTAQVLEISDQASGAGVMLETTRIRGVLRGNAFGQPQIINILPDDRIKPGERVLTSGGDQIYPRGLPVGTVERVANDPERNPYIDVIVKPGANLSRLEEVLIITSAGDQLPPGVQNDLAKSEAEARQHSAAEVLSEKLPSIRDPNDPNSLVPGATAVPGTAAGPAAPDTDPAKVEAAKKAAAAALVTRALKPPPPLHPDRFTTGASSSGPTSSRADGDSSGGESPTNPAPVRGTTPPAKSGASAMKPAKVGTPRTSAPKSGAKTKQKPSAASTSAPLPVTPPPALPAETRQPDESVARPEPATSQSVEPSVAKPEPPKAGLQQPRPGGNPLTRLTRKLFKRGPAKPPATEQQPPAPGPVPQGGR